MKVWAFATAGPYAVGSAAPTDGTQDAEQEAPDPLEQQRSQSARPWTLQEPLPADPAKDPRAEEYAKSGPCTARASSNTMAIKRRCMRRLYQGLAFSVRTEEQAD